MKKIFNKYYSELVGLFVFIIYLFTTGRSIGEFDSGELAMCQATLSIPHPTGYPLFVLVGYIFSKIPLPVSTIIKLNILGAIWCSLAVIYLIKSSYLLINNFSILLKDKFTSSVSSNELTDNEKKFLSVFAGLMLAFSATFWLQSSKVEVYSLQIFLSSLIIYSCLKIIITLENYTEKGQNDFKAQIKTWLPVAVLVGISFANHMMTLYLLPAIIFIYFSYNGFNLLSIKTFVLLFFVSFLISAVFYFGLMLRAQSSPPWAYGNPSNFNRLIDHITAKEYTKYLSQNAEEVLQQGSKLMKMLSLNLSSDNFSLGEFGLSLFIGLAGLMLLFLFKRSFSLFIVLVVFTSIGMAISYNIPDINEYFLVAFFNLSLLSVLPNFFILNFLRKNKILINISYSILFLMIAIQFIVNFNYADRSDTYAIEDFCKAAIGNTPDSSIILTDNWSSMLSPGLYYQKVEKYREDVKLISPSGIIQFDWYNDYISEKILDKNFNILPKENVYLTFDVVNNLINKGILKIPEGYVLVPAIYYYKLQRKENYEPLKSYKVKIPLSKSHRNPSEIHISVLIPFLIENRILYELEFNQTDKAKILLDELTTSFNYHIISEYTLTLLAKKKLL